MPDAPSYFTDDSMLRRVHREWAVALSAPRALLMQAAHPVAFAGFFTHTGSLSEPYERLERTAEVMDTIIFGSRARADRMTRRVRAMHRRVAGELREPAGRFPAGTPYRADDPELLLWILATLVDSALLVYQRYVRPLTAEERDAYWQDYKTVGHLFGLRDEDMPGTAGELDEYMADMLSADVLHVSDEARRLAVQIVMNPPVPRAAVPLLKSANFATVGLLPERLRRAYGFSWDPVRGLAVRAGAEYTRRVLVPLLPSFIRHVPRARAA
ncbi:MAG TPA: oxygenase MpaB family protein [Solirubrobacteraceae bacterium]|jgi:uncharacterized protein (DUF2236 family)|nr:oxygenase MpaB family protein [Solirubrobacteraceae bacterium]